jgi:hypothetical protein
VQLLFGLREIRLETALHFGRLPLRPHIAAWSLPGDETAEFPRVLNLGFKRIEPLARVLDNIGLLL